MPNKLKVTSIDNRGSAEHPFGYVYFSDDMRLGFGSDDGYGPYGLFSGNWGTGSDDHFILADSALVKHFK